jgi:hypothetical protein
MILDIHPFQVLRLVESLLGMGSTHIGTSPPFRLDGVPSLFRRPGRDYAQTGNISTVKCYVTSRQLVSKDPFVKSRGT